MLTEALKAVGHAACQALHKVGVHLRSPHWPAVRAAHLKLYPACSACGRLDFVQVHHVRPFHLYPALELVENNLVTLCEAPGVNHHLEYGHQGNWSRWNPYVRRDAARALSLGPAR